MMPRAALACIGFAATGFLCVVDSVRGNDLWLGQGYGPRAVEPCDPFAEDAEAGTCSKFGGRVRVDLSAQGPLPGGEGSGASPAAVRIDDAGGLQALPRRLESGIARRHLRVPSTDATGTFDPSSAR